MREYLTYGRTADGIVFRTSKGVYVSNEDLTKSYPYEQVIVEYPPEVKVHWQHFSGASFGIASADHLQIPGNK